jgi:signal transduction histidine kinase
LTNQQRSYSVEVASREEGTDDRIQTVAHDLQSPICSLRGFVRLLQQDFGGSLEDRARSYLDCMLATVDRMQALVHELLTPREEEDLAQRRGLVEAREVCQQLAADLKPLLDERGIELVLPPAPPPVYSYRTQLLRILSNLVCNAIQHMGSVDDPRIVVDLRRAPRGVDLVVQDNGNGIPPGIRERIFEPFYGNGSTRTPARSGLGLAIVKRIVEAHGGWITVDSPPARGATFRVFLPDPTI